MVRRLRKYVGCWKNSFTHKFFPICNILTKKYALSAKPKGYFNHLAVLNKAA
jgi:hypothetical protein